MEFASYFTDPSHLASALLDQTGAQQAMPFDDDEDDIWQPLAASRSSFSPPPEQQTIDPSLLMTALDFQVAHPWALFTPEEEDTRESRLETPAPAPDDTVLADVPMNEDLDASDAPEDLD
ncbi:unnamed protein product, partial [Mycena citricolor]